MEPLADRPDVEIRVMRGEDIDAVVEIETQAFSSPWRKETFAELIGRPTLEMLVMEHREEGIVGYAVVWCILDQGELANLAILPRMRSRGLGTRLLARAIEIARQRRVETMFLEVRASNAHALELYRRFGFAQVGLRRGYYDHPKEDAFILRAQL